MLKLRGKRNSHSPIGVDIGRRGVRMVQLATSAGEVGDESASRWGLFKAYCWESSSGGESDQAGGAEGAPDDGPVAALRSRGRHLELGGRLKRLLRQNEFHGQGLIVGLSGPEVELHALELPIQRDGGAERNVRQAAHWEIERLMSFAESEVESDFWWLPPSQAAGARGRDPVRSGQPTAIGVAAEKVVVSGVWGMCEAAGVTCRRLDANLCALSRFGAWLRSLPAIERPASRGNGQPSSTGDDDGGRGEIWGLLDLGYAQVRLVVCVDEAPVLVRCFDTGGKRWIERISESLELSFSAAEIHLRDHGITSRGERKKRGGTQQEGRGIRRDDPAGQGAPSTHLGGIIRNLLREELDALSGEIERSYRYVMQCYPKYRTSDLMLVGGGAELRNLDEYLQGHLGIDVYPAAKRLEDTVMAAHIGAGTPFMRSGAGGRYRIGALACAIGLAIPPE